jgi:hypothetical protein
VPNSMLTINGANENRGVSAIVVSFHEGRTSEGGRD